jgi:hypothetical protein
MIRSGIRNNAVFMKGSSGVYPGSHRRGRRKTETAREKSGLKWNIGREIQTLNLHGLQDQAYRLNTDPWLCKAGFARRLR